jgi:hypothetical protein
MWANFKKIIAERRFWPFWSKNFFDNEIKLVYNFTVQWLDFEKEKMP